MNEMQGNTRVSLMLLLADLHFGPGPLAETEVPPLEPTALGRLLGLADPVGQFFQKKCAAQDGIITQRLTAYVRSLLAEASRHNLVDCDVDLCLLLGDLVTFPHPEAFAYLVHFVTQRSFTSETVFGRLTSDGLGIPADRLLVVPGNHDKLLLKNLNAFYEGVSKPLGLPAKPREQSCTFVSRSFAGWEFLFILVDPNEYASGDMRLEDSVFEYRRHLAAGRITEPLVRKLRDGLQDLARGRQVDDAQLADYSAATKVLVLHYAASRWAVSGFPGRDELVLPHICRGIDALFDATDGHVDLVLHGHLHATRIYRHHGVPIISVPTLCQRGEQERGFFSMEAVDTGVRRTLHARYHRWDKFAFVNDPSHTIALQCRMNQTSAI
jgi:hypothetical protein